MVFLVGGGGWFSIYPIENIQGEKTTKMPEDTTRVSPLWSGACQRHVCEYAEPEKRELGDRGTLLAEGHSHIQMAGKEPFPF